ncbi:hypothetical protein KAT36_03030 [Candidatus Pacearchaeota archaeon]|nr:hypothetical protein [Candidatus Pacearchaeota archaeon]
MVKEVRELEDEVKEIGIEDSGKGMGDWEENNFEGDEDLEDDKGEKGFSIGDTMLARGEAAESWEGGDLEESVFDGGNHEDWDGDLEEGGFSYEAMSGGSSGDFYGSADGDGRDLYGTGSGGGDLYGAGENSKSGSLYSASSECGDVCSSSMYNVSGSGSASMVNYNVEVSKPKKRERDRSKRQGNRSGLESFGGRKRSDSRRGVSIL